MTDIYLIHPQAGECCPILQVRKLLQRTVKGLIEGHSDNDLVAETAILPTVLSFELRSPYPLVVSPHLPAASYVHD